MHERDIDTTTRGPSSGTGSATETAKQATETAKQSAKDVAGTAKDQGRQVASEVGNQARSVGATVRQSVAGQARTGHDKLTESLRKVADDLGNMHGGETSSPAGQIVSRLADTGRRAADHLQSRGPEGLLDDVQEFARRKPGTFLLAAAAAGFVIGRLGRSTVSAARGDDDSAATGYGATSAYGTTADYGTGGYGTTSTYGTTGDYGTTGGYGSAGTTGGYQTGTATGGLVNDPYATPTGYDTPSTAGGTTAVGTASVDPASYPADPVGVPSERGTTR